MTKPSGFPILPFTGSPSCLFDFQGDNKGANTNPWTASRGAIFMKHFIDNRLHALRDAIHRNRQVKALRRSRSEDTLDNVEHVVDGTDSKIRLVPGYRKKLQDNIQSSLDYADEVVGRFPKAIEVSSRTFTTDPYVNAFFANVPDLQSVFSHSSEVQDYMEDIHENDSGCCALLCMRRTEKTVLGIELSGDMLKKDVRQIAVSFTDHRIYSPAPSEPGTRNGLRHCLFQGLVTNALERIMKLRLASHRMQSRHQMLHSRLRHYTQQLRSAEPGSGTAAKLAHKIAETEREIAVVEENMMNTPALLTPQVLLDQVADVFSKPEDFVKMKKVPLRLDKMGIKISDNSPQPDNKLDLTEVIIGNELPRVVTLATFPRKELLPRTVFSLPG
jgi:hypothetical protein